jgi:hypothetical protein
VEILRTDDGLRFVAKVLLARELAWFMSTSRWLGAARQRLVGGGLRRLKTVLGR